MVVCGVVVWCWVVVVGSNDGGLRCGHVFFFFFDQKGQFISARGHSGPSSKLDTDFGEARVCIRAAARDCASMVSH